MNPRIATFASVLYALLLFAPELSATEQLQEADSTVARDPRLGPSLTLLYDGQPVPNVQLGHAVLIFATLEFKTKSANKILGVPGAFSDAQIIGALQKFYSIWKPDEGRGQRKPQIILAAENWGAGATLYEPLKELSKKFEIDVYFYYPVGASFAKASKRPTPNDKRVASLN